MDNKIKDGKTLRFVNTGNTTIPSGAIVRIGSVLGVAFEDIPAGEIGILVIDESVHFYTVAPQVSDVPVGTPVFMSDENTYTMGADFTYTPSTNSLPVGFLAFTLRAGRTRAFVKVGHPESWMNALFQYALTQITPSIDSESRNWLIGGVDTGILARGVDGETPYVDPDTFHWFIGDMDTGIVARGLDGETPTVAIDLTNKHWIINDVDTGVVAEGKDGHTPVFTIDGTSKHWLIDGVDTGVKAEGIDGNTPVLSIDSVSKHWFVNGVDTGVVAQGVNGLSAYQIWLAQGNTGTEADFLASLQGHITTVEAAIASFVEDSGDDDDESATAYKLTLPGYIVGIRAYADDTATIPDRYDTKITYDADADESTVWLSEAEHDYFAALTGGKALLYIDTAEAMTSGCAFPLRAVTTLPTTPIAGQMIRLTAADDTAKVAPGVYMHDGVGWTCISYASAYALGNLGATPSLALIPGAAYTATVDAEITSFTVAFTRPGLCSITLTNASTLAVAQPEMTGRTSKLLTEGAWDGAATALSVCLLNDDGTYIIVSAGGLA